MEIRCASTVYDLVCVQMATRCVFCWVQFCLPLSRRIQPKSFACQIPRLHLLAHSFAHPLTQLRQHCALSCVLHVQRRVASILHCVCCVCVLCVRAVCVCAAEHLSPSSCARLRRDNVVCTLQWDYVALSVRLIRSRRSDSDLHTARTLVVNSHRANRLGQAADCCDSYHPGSLVLWF